MRKLIVILPENRDFEGILRLEDQNGRLVAGPFAVCGRADGEVARRHGNSSRHAILPFGDTPLGRYRIAGILPTGRRTNLSAERFGPYGVVVLKPAAGEAALADANGRFCIVIQGGKLGPGRRLRPTNGSLRLADKDQKRLVRALRRSQHCVCDCVGTSEPGTGRPVARGASYEEADPPLAGSLLSLPVTAVEGGQFSREPGQPRRFGPPSFHLSAGSGGGGAGAGGGGGYDTDDNDDVDLSFISTSEGGQTLQATVPDPEGSQSGATIGTGVDLGQLSVGQLNNLDIPAELRAQLEPYVGLQGTEAEQFLAQHPLEITPEQAEQLDRAVLDPLVDSVSDNFDRASTSTFSSLPQAAQTVIADVATQYGSNLSQATPTFWTAVTEGRWQDAVNELRDFGDRYPSRRGREADLLQAAIDSGGLPAAPNPGKN
ncbi:MAG: pesticin C-terminus-like muramidase [Candidatus Sulfotelmatobacter sp.]